MMICSVAYKVWSFCKTLQTWLVYSSMFWWSNQLLIPNQAEKPDWMRVWVTVSQKFVSLINGQILTSRGEAIKQKGLVLLKEALILRESFKFTWFLKSHVLLYKGLVILNRVPGKRVFSKFSLSRFLFLHYVLGIEPHTSKKTKIENRSSRVSNYTLWKLSRPITPHL